MGNNKKADSAPLSAQELAKEQALLAEIITKLSILLANPRTPETFKDAFMEAGEEA